MGKIICYGALPGKTVNMLNMEYRWEKSNASLWLLSMKLFTISLML